MIVQILRNRPMPPKRCFYSVVQFTPAKHRQEAVNIAILVEAPEFGYRGAKYLRHMDSLLRTIDPLADVDLIRSFVKGLEVKFKRSEVEKNHELYAGALLKELEKPVGLDEIIEDIRSSGRLPISITDRRPSFFPLQNSVSWKLDSLYNSLIYRPRELTRENLDKDYVRRTSVDILEKFINVELDIDPVNGFKYQDNEFDAGQKDLSGNLVSFFEFLSYDVKTPDTSQMKGFLETVDDVRRIGKDENSGYRFNAIVQPPKNNREKENVKAFDLALEYAEKREVPVTMLEADGIARLGRELQAIGQ